MKKILKKIFFAVFPILFITSLYACFDPFCIVHHYDYSSLKFLQMKKTFDINQDYIKTEIFIKNFKDKYFDTYVFGNSKSLLLDSSHLQNLFSSPSYYNYAVNFENIYGIEKKLEYLDTNKKEIKNVLLGFDADVLRRPKNSTGHLFRKHPILTEETYFNFQFLCYIDIYEITFIKILSSELKNRLFNLQSETKLNIAHLDSNILTKKDSIYYSNKQLFYNRSTEQQFSKPVIMPRNKIILSNIARILKKHNTNYYILIQPLYNQTKLSPSDMRELCTIFEKNRIYDFSGKNDITNDKYNYYENAHYKKAIANKILDSILLLSKVNSRNR